jgi:hypothetical protein
LEAKVADPSLLLIADIGGYTQFMRLHRESLAHAQEVTARLLRAVVKAVPELDLVEIEGDAGFFARPGGDPANILDLSLTMHQAFHAEQANLVANNLCNCDACKQTGELRVKFVAHLGEVATQTIQRRRKLIGVDVITVHRLLKNDVPVAEYLLMTDPILEGASDQVKNQAVGLVQDLEGLGETQTYWLDVSKLAPVLPQTRTKSLPSRLGLTLGVGARSLPYLIRLHKPRHALAAQDNH